MIFYKIRVWIVKSTLDQMEGYMNRNLYVKIAYWYHTLGMTQDEIAKRLSYTRQKVNQIINSLPDMGIVTLNIHG